MLGGGAGTRLYPLTASRAKPAVPIGGAYRLIDMCVRACARASRAADKASRYPRATIYTRLLTHCRRPATALQPDE